MLLDLVTPAFVKGLLQVADRLIDPEGHFRRGTIGGPFRHVELGGQARVVRGGGWADPGSVGAKGAFLGQANGKAR